MSETNEYDAKSNKAICLTFSAILISAVCGVTGYNIHANVYESENLAAEAGLVRAIHA